MEPRVACSECVLAGPHDGCPATVTVYQPEDLTIEGEVIARAQVGLGFLAPATANRIADGMKAYLKIRSQLE